MATNHTRAGKYYQFSPLEPHHFRLGRNSKAGRGVECFLVEQKEGLRCTWRRLAEADRGYWRLAEAGGSWQRLAEAVGGWQKLAEAGRGCWRLAEAVGSWQKLAETGGSWWRLAVGKPGAGLPMKWVRGAYLAFSGSS